MKKFIALAQHMNSSDRLSKVIEAASYDAALKIASREALQMQGDYYISSLREI